MTDNFNNDYEKAILSIMLLDNSLIDMIKTRVSEECFYNPQYKLVFKTIIKQWEADKCSNILTLSNEIKSIEAAKLSSLSDFISSTSNWEFYVNKINDYKLLRTMKTDLNEISNKISADNINEVVSELNTKSATYLQRGDSGSKSVKDLCLNIPVKIQQAFEKGSAYLGYESGWEQIDDISKGFQTKTMYVIGARPSIGKTAFGMNLITRLASKGVKCSVFSLEMSAEALFYRMLAVESKIPLSNLQTGECMGYKDSLNKLRIGLTNLYKLPLDITDIDAEKEETIYSKIRYDAKVNGTKVFLIDHLGLIRSMNKGMQRYEQVGNITSTLHKLAKELDVCIILLCQLGRGAEGSEPNMALLRESGNIEQDADVIMFLHRERDMTETSIPTKIIFAKNRDGKIGTANMLYLSNYTKFVEDKTGYQDRNDEKIRR